MKPLFDGDLALIKDETNGKAPDLSRRCDEADGNAGWFWISTKADAARVWPAYQRQISADQPLSPIRSDCRDGSPAGRE